MPSKKTILVTLTDLAARVGRSREAIYNAKGRGVLPPANSAGKYDLDACIAALKAEEAAKMGTAKRQDDLKLLDARRKLRSCEKAELELELMRKEVIPVVEVQLEVSRMIQAAKMLLLALPSQLSATVVGLSPAQAEKEIRDGVLRALEQLSSGAWNDAGSN